MTQAINSIHTSCKNCVFSIYENITQTDCALKYIDLYKDKNIEVLEAYDNDKEFYIINNKKCIGYREPKWFDRYNMSDSSMSDKITKYHELNRINYFMILDTFEMSTETFEECVKNISAYTYMPEKLIIIRYAYVDKTLPFTIIEDTFKKYNLDLAWKIHTILDEELSTDDILYQTITQNNKYRFVLYTKDTEDTDKLLEKANDIVYKELDQFNILSTENKRSLIFSIGIYKYTMFHGENILDNDSYYTII